MHKSRNFFFLSVKHNPRVLYSPGTFGGPRFLQTFLIFTSLTPFSAAGGAFFFFMLLPLIQLLLITVCHVVTVVT